MATDAEAAWYLSTTSLAQPLDSTWTKIYIYVFNKTMESMRKEVPEDLKAEKLSDYEINYHLLPLKRWLYKVRSERRKGIARDERREQREQVKQEKSQEKCEKESLQTRMFGF